MNGTDREKCLIQLHCQLRKPYFWDGILCHWLIGSEHFWTTRKSHLQRFPFLVIPLHVSPSTITFEQMVLQTIISHLDVNSWPGIDAKNACFGNSSSSGTTLPKAIVFYALSHTQGSMCNLKIHVLFHWWPLLLQVYILSEICIQACHY